MNEKIKVYIYLRDDLDEENSIKIFKKIKRLAPSANSEFFISNSGAKIIFGGFKIDFLNKISKSYLKNSISRIEKSLNFCI